MSAARRSTWNTLRPGTYLIESGTQPSIQGPMGLYGVLVVTEPDDTTGANPLHQAYGTKFDTDVALLLSEIDPVQNAAVDQAVKTTGFSDALVWNGQPTMCGDPTVHTCYPPAVNYSPLYYLINGISFDRTAAAASAVTVPATAATGNLLLRFVNAGLRMHVPSVVGATMTLLAEDGNKLPGNPRVQTQALLTAGKTYDVAIQPAQIRDRGSYAAATYPVFDRALSLSTANQRDGGMQAYINVAGGGAQAAAYGTAGSAATALTGAGAKTFYCVAGTPLTVSDASQGLLAGVTGANGVVARRCADFQRRCQRREPERSIERHLQLHAAHERRRASARSASSSTTRGRSPPRSPTALAMPPAPAPRRRRATAATPATSRRASRPLRPGCCRS